MLLQVLSLNGNLPAVCCRIGVPCKLRYLCNLEELSKSSTYLYFVILLFYLNKVLICKHTLNNGSTCQLNNGSHTNLALPKWAETGYHV